MIILASEGRRREAIEDEAAVKLGMQGKAVEEEGAKAAR